MRILCPHCGERDAAEFAYRGDANMRRPEDGVSDMVDYVYPRDNPAGAHREFWFHAHGCRAWFVVERDTRTHAISGVSLAGDEAS